MNKILVPTDFSDFANYALDVACQIAKKSGASIQLLHVLDFPTEMGAMGIDSQYVNSLNDFIEDLKLTATKKLNAIVQEKKATGVTIIPLTRAGFPKDILVEHANDKEVSLVVMGTQGSSGLEELLVGSTTEVVVRKSETPIITIPKEIKDFDIKKIVFSCEFDDKPYAGFKHVVSLASIYNAEIKLVRINMPANFASTRRAKALMNEFAKKWNLQNYTAEQYDHLNFEVGLNYYIEETKADVVALGTHGRQGLTQILFGSMTEEVVNHLKHPVLTFRI